MHLTIWYWYWLSKNIHLPMFLALPYYSHSFAKTFHSYFLYTTQGYAKDDEPRESVYRNDTEGCYIAGITQHERKNSFHLLHSLEVYQVLIIRFLIMKLYWLIWYIAPFCDYLFGWNAQDSPLYLNLMLLYDEPPIVIVHRTQEHWNFFEPCSSI